MKIPDMAALNKADWFEDYYTLYLWAPETNQEIT
jgi:hypothetical protein